MKSADHLACALLAGVLSAPVSAQQAIIPPLVVTDGEGDNIGPVVGFLSLTRPVLRLMDSEVGVPVFLAVQDDRNLEAAVHMTYFSGSDCTGTPYHDPAFGDASEGLAQLTGYAYSVADIGGGGDWLIRSDISLAGADITYRSVYVDDKCGNTIQQKFLRPALQVMDLNTPYPPPYTAQ